MALPSPLRRPGLIRMNGTQRNFSLNGWCCIVFDSHFPKVPESSGPERFFLAVIEIHTAKQVGEAPFRLANSPAYDNCIRTTSAMAFYRITKSGGLLSLVFSHADGSF